MIKNDPAGLKAVQAEKREGEYICMILLKRKRENMRDFFFLFYRRLHLSDFFFARCFFLLLVLVSLRGLARACISRNYKTEEEKNGSDMVDGKIYIFGKVFFFQGGGIYLEIRYCARQPLEERFLGAR